MNIDLKDIQQVRDDLLETINAQIGARRYMLDELIGSLYPSIVQDEIDQLHTLKEHILKLGTSEEK